MPYGFLKSGKVRTLSSVQNMLYHSIESDHMKERIEDIHTNIGYHVQPEKQGKLGYQ